MVEGINTSIFIAQDERGLFHKSDCKENSARVGSGMLPQKEDIHFSSQHEKNKAINQITIGFSERISLKRRVK